MTFRKNWKVVVWSTALGAAMIPAGAWAAIQVTDDPVPVPSAVDTKPDYIPSQDEIELLKSTAIPFSECDEDIAFLEKPEVKAVFSQFGSIPEDSMVLEGCPGVAYWQEAYERNKELIASGEIERSRQEVNPE
ncbi:hypothetical protein [Nocardioides sp.]|uniref:hypothetical protein n=1 Tax=Nocardioides sp. TaxID=35761 RepID=UPI0039E705C3